MHRRTFLGSLGASLVVARPAGAHQGTPPAPRKGRLRQGVTRGVFGRGVALEECCRRAAELGISGFDLVAPPDWPTRSIRR